MTTQELAARILMEVPKITSIVMDPRLCDSSIRIHFSHVMSVSIKCPDEHEWDDRNHRYHILIKGVIKTTVETWATSSEIIAYMKMSLPKPYSPTP